MSTIVNDPTQPLADRIAIEREARGWSLAELADMGLKCVEADLLLEEKVVRHDQDALARLLLERFVRAAK